ncbi:MAG: ImmA/IrrE family metallo-endopeptidase [Armatimonadota bacterium]
MAVQRLTYNRLRNLATTWLSEHHPSTELPVPIEYILESAYSIDIIPVPGLMNLAGVDGYLAADQSIYVDDFVYQNRENRYRFTLAHELAHIELHWELLADSLPRSIDEANQRRLIVDSSTGEWTDEMRMHWQAHCWAGLVLVPADPLEEAFQRHTHLVRPKIEQAIQAGLSEEEYLPSVYRLICEPIASIFQVSADVIQRRIERDELLPPLPREE